MVPWSDQNSMGRGLWHRWEKGRSWVRWERRRLRVLWHPVFVGVVVSTRGGERAPKAVVEVVVAESSRLIRAERTR